MQNLFLYMFSNTMKEQHFLHVPYVSVHLYTQCLEYFQQMF